MNTDFETVANALLICYDVGLPVLATDPSITDSAYLES